MKTMMIAQNPFRKNKCDKKYTVLLYLSMTRREGFWSLRTPNNHGGFT
jgi:hypothetical protein